MSKQIDRPDPMISCDAEMPERIHISVLTYRSRDDLDRLPSNVTVGLAVPEDLPIDEWSRRAKIEIAKAQSNLSFEDPHDQTGRQSTANKERRD